MPFSVRLTNLPGVTGFPDVIDVAQLGVGGGARAAVGAATFGPVKRAAGTFGPVERAAGTGMAP